MFNLLGKIFGDPQERKVRQYQPKVADINALEEDMQKLSDSELRALTAEFQQRIANGASLDSILAEAFAVVREAARRVLGLKHYDVQLIGGMVLHSGQIAEMKTGEGKTLVSTLPAYLNALSGKGVHVVTVNDYLARRDSEWMGQVHRFLGLSVGLIQNNMDPGERRRNYACDITYATNSELGFDYLRDNMASSMEEVVQRPFNYAVIDEVDSILIDEARTPLIISGMVAKPAEKYNRATAVAAQLKKGEHYEVAEKERNVLLTDEGFEAAEQLLDVRDLFDPADPWAHFVFNAVKAKELFLKDVSYIVRSGEVVIVDEFTGRIMPGRRWSDGLHQAIESKEGVKIENETQTLATITYQNFFLLYPKLSGMTGTALTEEAEFGKIYNLEVTPIPTNRKVIRSDWPDQVYKSEKAKWVAVAKEIQELYGKGRPVLVGTTSVEKSEVLSGILREYAVPHNLLNAKPENVERESEIVAQAGRRATVTISTNMAGRGTDILLGGNAEYMARLALKAELVPPLQEEPETQAESPLALLQGAGRRRPQARGFATAKKPSPVTSSLFPCELSSTTLQTIQDAVDLAVQTYGPHSLPPLQIEDMLAIASERAPVEDPVVLKLRSAFKQIYDEFRAYTDREHDEVVALGGLHVIGTERHESRRIDNQLRGRAGRQGDPGSTRFFLSLEDNLLRIFGGDRVAGLMDAFRVEEDMPIESGMLTKALENAQRKVEVFYYDQRKQVFEYDEVLNIQRKAIYTQRRKVLEGEGLTELVQEYIDQTVGELVLSQINPDVPPEEWDLTGLIGLLQQLIPLLSDLTPAQLQDFSLSELQTELKTQARLAFESKSEFINTIQPDLMEQAERFFFLQNMDNLWREHLQQMEALREAIGLRGYGQKDPLVEYKNEGYQMFLEMLDQIRRNVVTALYNFQPTYNPPPTSMDVLEAEFGDFSIDEDDEDDDEDGGILV
ncbi:preprotein translocase subunit SecA [Anthocerotibacter panamensis]|uniref:preprotein translocase subunit SecA n=1 Tax=Anthocerotibacter panamensis TaxID=2857077 RepID=UPI001C40467A|nr:preprotein translocase subunit SecA [Anthocerotibacter panamensis]